MQAQQEQKIRAEREKAQLEEWMSKQEIRHKTQ